MKPTTQIIIFAIIGSVFLYAFVQAFTTIFLRKDTNTEEPIDPDCPITTRMIEDDFINQ